jgi:integrase
MTTPSDTPNESKLGSKREEHLSTDGLWRSYPKVPNLLCYVKSGIFYARLKVNGKIIRRSLETNVFTTAKLKLGDFIKEHRTCKPIVGTFSQARSSYEAELASDHSITDNSKRYRKYCVERLLKSWPDLDAQPLGKITETACKAWAARLSTEVDETYFNNILGTLNAILKHGGLSQNPAASIKRLGIKKKELQLPEPEQFDQILHTIETAGARESKNCANFVRFLAFSGCRISEARQVTWGDVDLQQGLLRIRNAKLRRSRNAEEWRLVPIISNMAALLGKLHDPTRKMTDKVCAVSECEKSLTRACKLLGIFRITHHDLRHLFATRCIESGVDIPTVSKWLGHKDGGALAMKVYGHLRNEHSRKMAERVHF